MEYFIKVTGGYLGETIDDYEVVEHINLACWFEDYESAVKVAVYYSKKHNLVINYDIEIRQDEYIVKSTRLPIAYDIDDWFICDVCEEWTKVDDMFTARYNREKDICEQCHRDGS